LEDCSHLIQETCTENKPFTHVLHLWSISSQSIEENQWNDQRHENVQKHGIYNLIQIAKAFDQNHKHTAVQLQIVTSNLFPVFDEDIVDSNRSTLLGPAKVIPQELTYFSTRVLDVSGEIPSSELNQESFDSLIQELTSNSTDRYVAFRNGSRWVQSYMPISLSRGGENKQNFRKNGIYLLTGGMGEIGLEISEYLAQHYQAKLVLLGRSGLLARDKWDEWLKSHDEWDKTSRRIKKIQKIESLGSEILILAADVTDEPSMQKAVDHAVSTFGEIHGVFHVAGIVNMDVFSNMISSLNVSEIQKQLLPKTKGTVVLHKIFQNRSLDFCLLFSSNASPLGGIGLAAYSAANIFMDTFIKSLRHNTQSNWISVNWDEWNIEANSKQRKSVNTNIRQYAVTAQEGIKIIEQILANPKQFAYQPTVVSRANLTDRLEKWIERSPQPVFSHSQNGYNGQSKDHEATTSKSSQNESENLLTDIITKFLYIDSIKRDDNIFEMGGHSLMVIELASEIKKHFGVVLTADQIINHQTIAKLGALIQDANTSIKPQIQKTRNVGRLELNSVDVPQPNELEMTLTNILTKFLYIQNIQRDDNIFELGGHSLMLIELASAIEKQFGVVVTPNQILKHPTLAGLMGLIQEKTSTSIADKQMDTKSFNQEELDSINELLNTHSIASDNKEILKKNSVKEKSFLRALWIRFLQLVARISPKNSVRYWCHKKRGVTLGQNVGLVMMRF